MADRLFTVEEANALLPFLHTAFAKLFDIRQQAQALQPDTWAVLEKAVGNGGSKKAGVLLDLFQAFEDTIQQIQETGCMVKDFETGLVDFPSLRGDDVILLCWKYDEPKIAYWHTIDGGFAGRQPL
jgi:hypothetical protein